MQNEKVAQTQIAAGVRSLLSADVPETISSHSIPKNGAAETSVTRRTLAVAARVARISLKDAFITANAYYLVKLQIPPQITKSPAVHKKNVHF